MSSVNSFGTRTTLSIGGQSVQYFSLGTLVAAGCPDVARLPYSMKILLENLLRHEDGRFVKAADVEALARWDLKSSAPKEISFAPARVLLQDFTGVPCVVDLAAMRDGIARLGGDPNKVNPLQPVELVIDHSVQVDYFAQANAFQLNAKLEFSRNRERYAFLRWGQDTFRNFKVVPPDTGIVHQVNLEYLARVVFVDTARGQAYPDTLVGTDSHTTMINGLGVLGWGVGGIEAEAAMLGQPMSILIPQVLGFELTGELQEGATATDLVLTVTEMLRRKGVVGKFVEFHGPGLANLPLADRATIGNMSPEFGSTCAIFPIDAETLRYLEFSGRPKELVTLADGTDTELDNGHVVIAAITSCTNTSNPSVMLGAGILARNAVQRGLRVKPWVKTSLAPGSKVVTEYLDRAGLTEYLEDLGFHLVGYGCTTCIGNSGPLPQEISDVVNDSDLSVVSVLSGNRNFEGRINPDVKMNYLASPPLCVAYALAGTMDIDLYDEPLGEDQHGEPVFLKDVWPSAAEVADTVRDAVQSDMFRKSYGEVFDGDE